MSFLLTHPALAQLFERLLPDYRIMAPAAEYRGGRFSDTDNVTYHSIRHPADLVWQAGLIGTTPDGKPTGWADMHQRLFHANGDDSVYFVGDLMGAISPQFGHYPKSAHVANFIGQIVAKYIAQRVAGQEIKPLLQSPALLQLLLQLT